MSAPDLAAAATRIERNPLGRLMHGQRELFHSNLLAWFFDVLPDAADRVFRPLTHPGVGGARRVERERQHMDLVVHWPGSAPLVIENKVFSIPGRDQLSGYERAASAWGERPAFVLLSVSTPEFDLGDWTHLSYANLARLLDDAVPKGSSYDIQTMRHYAQLAGDLHDLIAAVDVASPDERVWLTGDALAPISSSQLRAALHKARANRVARAVKDLTGLGDTVKSGLTNSIPLVEWFRYAEVAERRLHVGWQLQGAQLRRAVIHHDTAISGHSAASRAAREDVSREHPSLFTFPLPAPQSRAGRKEFNHFAPDFVYQYVKAPDLTVAELARFAVAVAEEVGSLSSG